MLIAIVASLLPSLLMACITHTFTSMYFFTYTETRSYTSTSNSNLILMFPPFPCLHFFLWVRNLAPIGVTNLIDQSPHNLSLHPYFRSLRLPFRPPSHVLLRLCTLSFHTRPPPSPAAGIPTWCLAQNKQATFVLSYSRRKRNRQEISQEGRK